MTPDGRMLHFTNADTNKPLLEERLKEINGYYGGGGGKGLIYKNLEQIIFR
jgi:hypothetical protein